LVTFADRLKLLRTEKDLTQQDIANILNVGRATVAGYETKGKQPDFDKLCKLCELFNVSLDYLLGRSEIRDPYNDLEAKLYEETKDSKSLDINELNKFFDNIDKELKAKKAETLAERFLDLLIDCGEIKTKEDLTTGKALKILGKIFDQLKEDTK